MRIAFNALYLRQPYTGTGRYTYNLLSALGRIDGINDYIILSPSPPPADLVTPSTFAWPPTPITGPARGSRRVEKVYWEQRVFPLAAKQHGAQLTHVPYFAPPFRSYGIPFVVTVHDVVGLKLPEYRASTTAHAYARLVQRTVRRAAAIIAVSHYAKQDILELLGVPEERIHVIAEAPAPTYHRVNEPLRLRAVREKYGLGPHFVLNVGGLDLRKNIAALIGAFAAVYHELNERDLQLFIAGDPDRLGSSPLYPDWRPLTATFGIAEQVLCMPVEEEDLPVLYSAASCFAFPSLYEGFGLTPLEAMACGAPVVCSNNTALREVVGSAGLLVDPDDAYQLGEAILRVLTDRDRRDDLSARGLAHVKHFSWDKAAVETAALYAEVSGNRSN
jgi:glycosyltransferase involved in cell wall biosynthesis